MDMRFIFSRQWSLKIFYKLLWDVPTFLFVCSLSCMWHRDIWFSKLHAFRSIFKLVLLVCSLCPMQIKSVRYSFHRCTIPCCLGVWLLARAAVIWVDEVLSVQWDLVTVLHIFNLISSFLVNWIGWPYLLASFEHMQLGLLSFKYYHNLFLWHSIFTFISAIRLSFMSSALVFSVLRF